MRTDALVIGGSFAGLSAAMQLARAGRPVTVLDTGSPRNRFAAASHGFFGQDGLPPAQMIGNARRMLAAYPSVRFVDAEALGAEPDGQGGFVVALAGGAQVQAKKLVLAFGVEDELPDVPGLAPRWGRTVLHCPYCHGYEFRQRPLGVLHGASFSPQKAMLVADWGPTTLFLQGAQPPDATVRAQLAARGVAIETAPIAGLEGEGTALQAARLADGRRVPLAALFVAPRTRPRSAIAAQLGCAFDENPLGPVIRTDPMTKLTSVPGIYAAGDLTRGAHNATLASADGVLAGGAAHQSLVFEPLA